jgi:uncharacterized protein (TIGR02266 family)
LYDVRVSESAERRASPRQEATFRVRYRSLDEFVVAYTTNISRGGMYVLTDAPLPVGTMVNVSLELPDADDEDGPVVPCTAKVAYVDDGSTTGHQGMGLELVDVPTAIIQSLLVEALSESAGGEPDAQTHASARVLVVDDDRLTRERIRQCLEGLATAVDEAENGLEALGRALSNQPDLILSDVEMPGMNGWQLLRIVRSRPKLAQVPVVFLTHLKGEAERLRGYELGVDDYLAKPIEADELRARVRGLLLRSKGRIGGSNALRGDLAHVSLTSVLAFIHAERRSGHLLVISGRRLATLVIQEGNVHQVRIGRTIGADGALDRLFRVLDWTEGSFELAEGAVVADDEVRMSTSAALLEWARISDEARASR